MKKSNVILFSIAGIMIVSIALSIYSIISSQNIFIFDDISQINDKFDSEIFGGLYYDNNSVLNINLTDEKMVNKLNKETSVHYGLKYNHVSYNLLQLEKVNDMIIEKMREDVSKIRATGVDITNNKVLIELLELDENVINNIKVYVDDQNMIHFIEGVGEITFT